MSGQDRQSLMLALERIEKEAWEDVAKAAPAPFAQGIGLQTADIDGAFLMMASRVPQFQFNWLSGTGLNGDDGRSIAEAVAKFKSAGQQKFFIQIPPGPNAARCETQAAEAGLRSHPLAWAKFHRTTMDAPRIETGLTIREAGTGERDVFAQTAVAGFGMPPPMAMWLSQIVGRPHWHAYVSFDGSEPVGAGALYVKGEYAWLGIGSTKPDKRKKGGQSALLARRIADAAKYGAKYATTETGIPQAGSPAPSYANILKAGFAVVYDRPNWTLPENLPGNLPQ